MMKIEQVSNGFLVEGQDGAKSVFANAEELTKYVGSAYGFTQPEHVCEVCNKAHVEDQPQPEVAPEQPAGAVV